ncbi:putative endonuclease or glycosyl hydrolase [Tasmannia lanceolata]|uniref:putative endonuclease or glycosyl hydrolase n=1 Tax=Tasmannia lanceolata TaxID=3420 RepID=UPI004064B593
MMINPNPSLKIVSSESSNISGPSTMNSNMVPPHVPNHQITALDGPVGILWDIENCPVPSDVRAEDVAGNIRLALRVHPLIKGVVTMFSAYGDFNGIPRRLREGFQRTGVKLIDVPNGRKDAADKAILVDMFLFALDNSPPSSILLISGDVDFAPALHILGQRGYTVILVIPSGVGISSALRNAGRFVWDWPSIVRGEGFVPPKALISRGPDISGYLMSCHLSDNLDAEIEDEAIVFRGLSESEYTTRANMSQIYCFNSAHVSGDFSGISHSLSEYSTNMITMPYFPTTRSQSLPCGLNDAQDQTSWVQPGDLQGLKGQIVKLVELSGGSLSLVRVPSEYQKLFGRPLYILEYGESKLRNLLKKMADKLTVEGKGNKKFVCLRNPMNSSEKVCPSIPSDTPTKDRKGKRVQEERVEMVGCIDLVCSSDEFSDDERVCGQEENEPNKNLGCFKQELQELLVSCSCQILLTELVPLYEQRYKKVLDYRSFGVDELEELIEKVTDIVVLHEEPGSQRKFLIASCVGG